MPHSGKVNANSNRKPHQTQSNNNSQQRTFTNVSSDAQSASPPLSSCASSLSSSSSSSTSSSPAPVTAIPELTADCFYRDKKDFKDFKSFIQLQAFVQQYHNAKADPTMKSFLSNNLIAAIQQQQHLGQDVGESPRMSATLTTSSKQLQGPLELTKNCEVADGKTFRKDKKFQKRRKLSPNTKAIRKARSIRNKLKATDTDDANAKFKDFSIDSLLKMD